MTTGIIRSFGSGKGLVHLLHIEGVSEMPLRVRASDKSAVAPALRGELVEFELARGGQGRKRVIDVAIIRGWHEQQHH
jgi:hypothetical protein